MSNGRKYDYRLKPLPAGGVTATYAVDSKGMVTIDVTAKGRDGESDKNWTLKLSEATLDKLTKYEIKSKGAIDDGSITVIKGDRATAWHAGLYVATHTEKVDKATGEALPGISLAELERIARTRFTEETAQR